MAIGYQTNILTKSYRGIQVCSFHTIEENLVDVGKFRHTKMCQDQNCVVMTGAFGQNVPTFGCRGDMLPTCQRLSQPRIPDYPDSGWDHDAYEGRASCKCPPPNLLEPIMRIPVASCKKSMNAPNWITLMADGINVLQSEEHCSNDNSSLTSIPL